MRNLIIAVEKAHISEVEDVINAALWRYWELHPGREIAAICLDAGDDRDKQIAYLMGRLQALMGKPDDELNQWPILIPRDMMRENGESGGEIIFLMERELYLSMLGIKDKAKGQAVFLLPLFNDVSAEAENDVYRPAK